MQIRERRFDSDLSLQSKRPRRSMIYEAFFIIPDVLLHTLRGQGGLYIVRSFAQRYRPNGEIGRRRRLKISRS
ncbi:hypothetical protein PSEUDO8O_50338 [Pseudomonas sp. 8O]|nr:hypothetical protein PSEUDO8O_50338 [Pseudomonas sp. 8O]